MTGHARDLMSGHVERVESEDTIHAALARLLSGTYGGLPVVRDDVVVGFLSETDLMIALLRNLPPETPVAEIMTSPARVVDELATTEDVMRTLREEGIHHLPVVRGGTGKLVGIISPKDVLRHFEDHVLPEGPAA
jgi:CIC family chloride channel protein